MQCDELLSKFLGELLVSSELRVVKTRCVLQVFIKIMNGNLRPPVANLTGSVPEWILSLLPLCWARLQEDRPSAAAICEVLSLESFV